MMRTGTGLLTLVAMIAFAANSVLCRLAIKQTGIDAGSFTSIRLLSGAVVLALLLKWRRSASKSNGSWIAAFSLFTYAAAFSFAYVNLTAGTGALLLFGAVQITMIGAAVWMGERLTSRQIFGMVITLAGFVILELPGYGSPPLSGALLMLVVGIAWAIYSLLGKRSTDPVGETAGNFLRTTPLAIILLTFSYPWNNLHGSGIIYAVVSGAVASALGYVVWYAALRNLNATSAATVQLSSPLLAAIGGAVFLSESISPTLAVASLLMLGGLYLVLANGKALATPNATHVFINGRKVSVEWTAAAECELRKRTSPLIVEMELYFSCLVKKFVHFHDAAEGRELFPVTDRLSLFFRPVISTACTFEAVELNGRQPEIEIHTPTARKIAPRYVSIDFRNGNWRGEFNI